MKRPDKSQVHELIDLYDRSTTPGKQAERPAEVALVALLIELADRLEALNARLEALTLTLARRPK